jgi:DNA-binding transcriptional LysR family regulator
MFDWNDLKLFVAVAENGSALAAARILGINQTTVTRRISCLEEDLGLVLFSRLQTGYQLTEAGAQILPWAVRMGIEADSFAKAASQQQRGMGGVIRVTVPESIANIVLTPALGDFAASYPDIRIQLLIDDRRLDLMRGEADVAIRAGSRPDDPNLVMRKLFVAGWTFYCSKSYAARHGTPQTPEQLGKHVLLAGEGVLAAAPAMKWMLKVAPDAEIHSYSSSLTNHRVAIGSGLGVGPLPCIEGDRDSELVRCFAPPSEFESDVLLITRADLKEVPRIRAFNDFIATRCAAIQHLARGLRPEEGK